MGDQMNVVTENLRAHSSKVDGVADKLQTAVDAAQQVTMNDDAYGIICQPFAMLLQPFEENGVEALSKAVESMQEIAEKVRSTAEDYQSVDDANSAAIGGIEVR
ncbi:ESX-1 secretion-associated protein [Saccharopolyspora shandongensis]|uniref:ESX-1 secretion-associated protein n=1 Tax=Saccharopolyspora shandongensis TaxID=418495 RepID=UPI0033C0D365